MSKSLLSVLLWAYLQPPHHHTEKHLIPLKVSWATGVKTLIKLNEAQQLIKLFFSSLQKVLQFLCLTGFAKLTDGFLRSPRRSKDVSSTQLCKFTGTESWEGALSKMQYNKGHCAGDKKTTLPATTSRESFRDNRDTWHCRRSLRDIIN